ncbi:nucleotidyltransferase domain-containing protein [Anaerovorax odorimutans]|uniref:Nucleotidyltransferase domain-containing protein n=1 Tax=Anaerovorax odorimutans TaxID=109327 RepID=A0ABT1RU01_9FIRM|nr:nucleotidyltransferase domain-containing protein [Anaerovorax odorimutans]MCQ4638626.1 nucleotidyltransferase domain-containing protein [Anaerovorax odorimutans]
MCSKDTLDAILKRVCERAKSEFGSQLNSVILYGSYAREDYDDESDIDVMVIVDLPASKVKEFNRAFSDFSLELDLQYDIVVSLLLQDKATFERWKGSSPFFKNVIKEGVEFVA